MNSDLIAMTFDGGETAQTVYESLWIMRKSQVLGLGDTMIVTKDGTGQVKLYPGRQTGKGLAGLLAHLIFGSPERIVLDGVGGNLDDEFVGTVGSALGDNGSALLLCLHPDSLSDTRELLDALALFRGTIHQTTLSPQGEALLREMP